MDNIASFLKELITAPGLSGHEEPVRKLIEAAWRPLTDELELTRIGSLTGRRHGAGDEPRPVVLIAAHMDAIGLMVQSIADGFLRVTQVGGLDHRVLPGQLVTVHGREDLPGVIVQPPRHLLPEDTRSGPVPLDYLLVDTGLTPRRVRRLVRPGDLISFAQPPIQIAEDQLAGHTLDNRASVAALTVCLELLQNRPHAWDLLAVATVQEEETMGGAYTAAYEYRPTLAIAIDVTHASGPGTSNHNTFRLGRGPVLGWGPNIHPKVFESVKQLADRLEIPYQIEVLPRHSGTDAYALQVAAEGVPTMLVQIPLRYMHTPVELVSLRDIERVGRLVAEFVAGLTPTYMESITWED